MDPVTQSRPSWQVICLCAAWCGVCREWLPVFRQLAQDRPGIQFAWIDVEDEDEAMGDVEVQTFPTLLIAKGGQPLFLGPVPPSAVQTLRLVDRLQALAEPDPGSATAAAGGLLGRLQPLLPRAGV